MSLSLCGSVLRWQCPVTVIPTMLNHLLKDCNPPHEECLFRVCTDDGGADFPPERRASRCRRAKDPWLLKKGTRQSPKVSHVATLKAFAEREESAGMSQSSQAAYGRSSCRHWSMAPSHMLFSTTALTALAPLRLCCNSWLPDPEQGRKNILGQLKEVKQEGVGRDWQRPR
jgi:hypothetical protein